MNLEEMVFKMNRELGEMSENIKSIKKNQEEHIDAINKRLEDVECGVDDYKKDRKTIYGVAVGLGMAGSGLASWLLKLLH